MGSSGPGLPTLTGRSILAPSSRTNGIAISMTVKGVKFHAEVFPVLLIRSGDQPLDLLHAKHALYQVGRGGGGSNSAFKAFLIGIIVHFTIMLPRQRINR